MTFMVRDVHISSTEITSAMRKFGAMTRLYKLKNGVPYCDWHTEVVFTMTRKYTTSVPMHYTMKAYWVQGGKAPYFLDPHHHKEVNGQQLHTLAPSLQG
jgi:hypothetical protein